MDTPARPYWARSLAWVLAWVLASVVVAGLLALLAQGVASVGRHDGSGPLRLGQAQTWRQAAGTPALGPQQALDTAPWQGATLPVSAGWTNDTVWLRLHLHNTGDRPQWAWLEVLPSRLTTVRLHSRAADGPWQTQASGNGVATRARPLDMAELAFPLELGAGERRLVLVEAASRGTPLAVDLAVHAAAAHLGQAMRANLPDLIIIGGVLMLGLASLMLGLTIGHLGLLLLAARALIGTLLELQQFGAGALYLSAPLAAALTEHAGLMLWAVQVLVAGFIWSFMAQAGVARWVHRVYGLFLLATLGLIAAPPGLAGPLVGIPFLVFTQLLNIHLIFRGYLPAVALLTGGITALAVNAPSMLGQPLGGVPRYVLSPLPLLLTLLLLLAVGWALHRERQQAAAALRDAQALALQGLEAEVAKRTAELQSARDEARRASQAKSVFLAKVSHELRTPLHALLGYLDLGLRQPLAPALQRQLSIARQAGQQLISQINDLLDHARSERAMLRLSPASLSLQSLALHLRNRMLLLAAERSNHFTLHCGPHLPAWVRADGSRLEQVLMALLSNAMRYTERGRVDLHITLAGPPATDGGLLAVSFMVEDNGPGIAPELLARLGQDFERGAAADGHGLGLGLAITRQLLALMDSQLVISSRLGSGSRFSFTLQLPRADEPLPPLLPPEPSARLAQPGRARRVLVLDDHAASRSYLAELLGATGLAVHGFAGVAEALAWLRACAEAGQAGSDLCIVDQHLGGLDSPARAGAPSGWYFIRGLHDLAPAGADGQACPVLMLSATAPRPPEGWAGETGIAGHLQKPVDPGLLLATVGELLALAWEPADGAGSGAPAAAGRSVGPAPMAGVVGSAGGAGTASWADPAGPSVAADAGAWQDLALLAESGSLSGLYEWAAAHPGLLAADAVLQSLIDRLDFAGIARRALRALDT